MICVRDTRSRIYEREFHWPRLNTSMTTMRAFGVVYSAFAGRHYVPNVHVPPSAELLKALSCLLQRSVSISVFSTPVQHMQQRTSNFLHSESNHLSVHIATANAFDVDDFMSDAFMTSVSREQSPAYVIETPILSMGNDHCPGAPSADAPAGFDLVITFHTVSNVVLYDMACGLFKMHIPLNRHLLDIGGDVSFYPLAVQCSADCVLQMALSKYNDPDAIRGRVQIMYYFNDACTHEEYVTMPSSHVLNIGRIFINIESCSVASLCVLEAHLRDAAFDLENAERIMATLLCGDDLGRVAYYSTGWLGRLVDTIATCASRPSLKSIAANCMSNILPCVNDKDVEIALASGFLPRLYRNSVAVLFDRPNVLLSLQGHSDGSLQMTCTDIDRLQQRRISTSAVRVASVDDLALRWRLARLESASAVQNKDGMVVFYKNVFICAGRVDARMLMQAASKLDIVDVEAEKASPVPTMRISVFQMDDNAGLQDCSETTVSSDEFDAAASATTSIMANDAPELSCCDRGKVQFCKKISKVTVMLIKKTSKFASSHNKLQLSVAHVMERVEAGQHLAGGVSEMDNADIKLRLHDAHVLLLLLLKHYACIVAYLVTDGIRYRVLVPLQDGSRHLFVLE